MPDESSYLERFLATLEERAAIHDRLAEDSRMLATTYREHARTIRSAIEHGVCPCCGRRLPEPRGQPTTVGRPIEAA
jgi:hypothetical protein